MMQKNRAHPINVIENTSKYFILLLLPLVRGLLALNGDLVGWLKGAWFDLLVVAAIIGMGYVRWYFYCYWITPNGIHVEKGILLKTKRFIPFYQLASVSIEEPFYFMPFQAVRLRADTDAGSSKKSDFLMTMRKEEGVEFLQSSKAVLETNNTIKKIYMPKILYVVILSLITSNSLSGVLFIVAFINQSGSLLGQEVEDLLVTRLTKLAEFLAFGLPPAAAIVGYVILGGWLISFVLGLIRHYNFTAVRQGDNIQIKAGWVIRRHYSIATPRVNLIEIRQTLITKVFGFFSVFIHCSGYGKGKDEVSVILPAGEKKETQHNLVLLFSEIPIVKKMISPKLRVLSRFLIPPVSLILGFFAVFGLAYWLIPEWRKIIFFLCIMSEIPSVWWLLVKITSFFHTSVGKQQDVFTFRYTYAFRIYTVSIPKHKIVKLTIRQSMFQKMANCCDVLINSYAEGTKRFVVPNLNYKEAQELFHL